MLEHLLFFLTISTAIYRPAVGLVILLHIYILRLTVSSDIDIDCVLTGTDCKVDNSPLFGAILPVIVFCIILVRTFINNRGIIHYRSTLFDWFFLINTILLIIACVWSPDFMNSIDYTGRYILLGIPYFYVTRLYFQNTDNYHKYLKQFLFTNYSISIILTCIGVYYYIFGANIIRMTIPSVHPIPYSMMIGQGFLIACGILFTGGQVVNMQQNWFKIFNIAMIFFFLFCQFLTNTRGVTIFMGFCVIILLILTIRKISFFKIMFTMPLLFLAFTFILSQFDPDVLFSRFNNGIEHDQSANERIIAWYDSIDMLGNNAFLGVGTNGYQYYGELPYPHNYFLEMAANFGSIGIILSMTIVSLFIFYAQFLSAKRGGTVMYQLVYVLALFNFLESIVSFTLWMHKGLYLWLGILMTLAPIMQKYLNRNDADSDIVSLSLKDNKF